MKNIEKITGADRINILGRLLDSKFSIDEVASICKKIAKYIIDTKHNATVSKQSNEENYNKYIFTIDGIECVLINSKNIEENRLHENFKRMFTIKGDVSYNVKTIQDRIEAFCRVLVLLYDKSNNEYCFIHYTEDCSSYEAKVNYIKQHLFPKAVSEAKKIYLDLADEEELLHIVYGVTRDGDTDRLAMIKSLKWKAVENASPIVLADYISIADNILMKVRQNSLLNNYVSHLTDANLDTFRQFLQICVADVSSDYKVTIKPVVYSVLSFIKKEVTKRENLFTYYDIMLDFQEYSYYKTCSLISESNEYRIDFESKLSKNQYGKISFIDDYIINKEGDFKNPLIRLAFLSLFLANNYNTPDRYFSDIKKYSNYLIKNKVLVNTNTDPFVGAIILGVGALINLPNDKRSEVISYLSNVAKCYEISKRDSQILAVSILSDYLLQPDLNISTEDRNRIFKIAFSETSYRIQTLDYLELKNYYISVTKNNENCFQDIIRNTHKAAIDSFENQPFYFFLYHHIFSKSDNSFESEMYKIRNETWESKIGKQIINRLAVHLSEIQAINETELNISFVLGFQALLYSISNIHLKEKSQDIETHFITKLTQYFPLIINLMFSTDYLLRLNNTEYQKYLSNNISGKATNFDLYLLCGAYRFTSTSISVGYKCKLTTQQKEYYYRCLLAEKGRYKVLLCRMLYVYSDFFDGGNTELLKSTCALLNYLSDSDFLEYDNINIIALKKHILNKGTIHSSSVWFRNINFL
ncbi:MAG: hypothetical protein MJ177_06200 [Clostridia bacterium]|nr:hypothetical protein [Clostridia bacterium]